MILKISLFNLYPLDFPKQNIFIHQSDVVVVMPSGCWSWWQFSLAVFTQNIVLSTAQRTCFKTDSKVCATSLLPVESWTGVVDLKPHRIIDQVKLNRFGWLPKPFEKAQQVMIESQVAPMLIVYPPAKVSPLDWRTVPGTSAANVHEALQAHYKDRHFVSQTWSWNRWLLLVQYVCLSSWSCWSDLQQVFCIGFDIFMLRQLTQVGEATQRHRRPSFQAL